ncbi:MAG: hypothetical protein HYX32_14785 [Actinobacteria bacterium]|nr:hypothetical protein [Actinomycetota bacterium]
MAYLGVAAVLLLFVWEPRQWFLVDEWDFLANRSATNLDDLFRDHNLHRSTLPILIYARCSTSSGSSRTSLTWR